ncbi:MAG TPA: deoxynucleoside kinase [Chitinophagaceae bacterium]|nr:deoxynucleoside kinase [Chitinophagaceae bacterium]
MKYRFITIEGNIGAGKTTLAHLLEKHFDARLILEQFADNPFLPKFYADRDQYAFPLELSFLAERFRQLKEVLNTRDLFNQYLISDYLFIKSKLFASVNLPDDEFKLYSTLFDIIQPNLPKPDLLIYLHAPMQKLRENIKQRNRSYEQNIPDEYLQNLQNAYLQLIRSDQYRTLIIDTSQTDFLNNKQQFERLIDYLDQDYEAGFHFLNFSDV